MKRRLLALGALSGLSIAVISGTALAGGHEDGGGPPLHGHALLTGVELGEDGLPISYRNCSLLANGQQLKLNAHHDHLHTGSAGEALRGKAGNFPVPLAPLTPFESCEDITAFIDSRG